MRIYPTELTPALRDALSIMLWDSAGIAEALRLEGHEIPQKAEDEQAHALHWCIGLVLEHGDNWREVGAKRLIAIAASETAKAEPENP
ncbi:MAG: hypothetical protein JJ902_05610 [Roseibium sp.]|nr:hypothetical protein [Roseibium sp.]